MCLSPEPICSLNWFSQLSTLGFEKANLNDLIYICFDSILEVKVLDFFPVVFMIKFSCVLIVFFIAASIEREEQ